MLPTRLLSFRRGDDHSVLPTWLTSRDEVWLRELTAEAAASDGRRVDVADERILELVAPMAYRHGASRRMVEAAWCIERRRWKTRVDSPTPPERIRRLLFELSAERSREEAIVTAANELGIDAAAIEQSLFADRARARKLVAPAIPSSPRELVDAYNLALVQSFLGRATNVVGHVRANLHAVVRYAKLVGLMMHLEDAGEGATRMTVSGPLALFHDTVKYGRALAMWFPAVAATPGWSIEARVILRDEPLRLRLDGTAPLPRTYALPREHDSKLEATLERELRALGSRWRIVRESAVVRAGARTFFPDFALVSERGRVLVEVAGFWTPEYLRDKALLLRAADVPIIICADERHARSALAHDPRVMFFQRRVDAASLIARCERALDECAARESTRSPPALAPSPPAAGAGAGAGAPETSQPPATRRHYIVIPESPSMRAHAVRAGAREARWREDVFGDLTSGGSLKLVARPARGRYGPQIGLIGRSFYAEANADGRRDDALFVHRVMPRAEGNACPDREHAVTLALLDTRHADSAERVDGVAALFAELGREGDRARGRDRRSSC